MSDDKTTITTSFKLEEALEKLDAIVRKMENGQLSLEEGISQFEEGTRLAKRCQQALEAAKQKVDILTRKKESHECQPYDNDSS